MSLLLSHSRDLKRSQMGSPFQCRNSHKAYMYDMAFALRSSGGVELLILPLDFFTYSIPSSDIILGNNATRFVGFTINFVMLI